MSIRATRIELAVMALALMTLIALAVAPAWPSLFGPQYQNPRGPTENPVILPATPKVVEGKDSKAKGIVTQGRKRSQ